MGIIKKGDTSQPPMLEHKPLVEAPQQPATQPQQPAAAQPTQQPVEVTMSHNAYQNPHLNNAGQQPHAQQQPQQAQQQQPYYPQQPMQPQGQPQAQAQQPQQPYTYGGPYQQQPQPGANAQMQPPYGNQPFGAQQPGYYAPNRSYAGNSANPYQLMTRPSTSISLKALEEGVTKCLGKLKVSDKAKERYGVPSVYSIDPSTSKISCDLLAIAIKPQPVNGVQNVLIQLLVLDTRQQPVLGFLDDGNLLNQNQMFNYQYLQSQPRVQLVPFDFVKNEIKETIKNNIMDNLGVPGVGADHKPNGNTATIVSTITIPKGFGVGSGLGNNDTGDSMVQNAIDNLVFMSTSALTTYYDTISPLPGMGVSLRPVNTNDAPPAPGMVAAPAYILDANFSFNESTIHDTLGQPIRSDVTINISLKPSNSPYSGSQIATVHGYMDMVYSNRPVATGNNGFAPGVAGVQNPFHIRYCPVFVITAIRSKQSCVSISDVLVAIAACSSLTKNGSTLWMNGFQTIRDGERAKSRDIRGVLNEVSLVDGAPPLGKVQGSENDNIFDIIQTTFINNMFIAMDIEESGETSWLDNILLESAHNSVYQAAIMRAADDLTNNQFTINYGSMPIIAGTPARVHLGEYRLGANVRDLRDLDTLSILNECNPGETVMSKDWLDSISYYTLNPPVFLEKREAIINRMLTSATINRYAKRVLLSGLFIQGLSDAINRVGVTIQASGVGVVDNLTYGATPYDPRFAMGNPFLQQQQQMFMQPGFYPQQPMMQPMYPQQPMMQQPFYPQQPYYQPQYAQPGTYQPQGYAQPVTGANVWPNK